MKVQRRSGKVKEVGGVKVYRAWKEWEAGDCIEGEFVGTSVDNYDKTNFHIAVAYSSFDESLVGKTMGLNHNGGLAYKMENIEQGEYIVLTYEGTTKLPDNHKFKGKDSHQVKVEVLTDEESESEGDLVDELDNI